MAGNQQAKSTFAWVSMDSTGQSVSPAYTFESETSLGFYRSASSTVALSYGTLSLPGNLDVTGGTVAVSAFSAVGATSVGSLLARSVSVTSTGQSVSPSINFSSESSLGFYRSAASYLALSYGTFASQISAIGSVQLAGADLNQGVLLSVRTLAASALTLSAANTNVSADEVVFVVGGASGASLAIHSGGTVYIFNSAISAAAT